MRHPYVFYVLAVVLAFLSTLTILQDGAHTRWDADTRNWTGAVETVLSHTDRALTFMASGDASERPVTDEDASGR